MHRSERLLRAALNTGHLLEENERVVVGLSGGADSLCLLFSLWNYNRRHRKNWQLFPVHIHPGFASWTTDRIERLCARLGLTCIVKRLDLAGKLTATRPGLAPCFICARERRKALFSTAHELNCRKVALGHHLEDVNETFLLNLLFTASCRTILPVQPLFRGAIVVIRPLYYFTERMIRTRLKSARLRPVRNPCPYGKNSRRMLVRQFLARLTRLDPRISTNIFWGIHNLKSEYLPEKPDN